MKNAVIYLMDNKGQFAYGENDKAIQVKVVKMEAEKIDGLVKLCAKEKLTFSLQGGITITQVKKK